VQPVNEPFLDILVELQWATGGLVREYTFLLDPPQYRDKPAAAAPVAPAPPQQVAKPAPVPAPAAPEARPLAPRPSAASPSAAATGRTYEVKKGDTLGRIARDASGDATVEPVGGVAFVATLVLLPDHYFGWRIANHSSWRRQPSCLAGSTPRSTTSTSLKRSRAARMCLITGPKGIRQYRGQ
jgi:hypothetical protein